MLLFFFRDAIEELPLINFKVKELFEYLKMSTLPAQKFFTLQTFMVSLKETCEALLRD